MNDIKKQENDIMFKNGKYTPIDIMENIGECNRSMNDLQRLKIDKFKQIKGKCFLGSFNKKSNNNNNVLTEYTGQKIYNFDYDFIVSRKDDILIDLIENWRETSNVKLLNIIQNRIEEQLFWS